MRASEIGAQGGPSALRPNFGHSNDLRFIPKADIGLLYTLDQKTIEAITPL
ncbi:MAG: hypothetical protein ABJQ90_16565 [Parasphingorhabdus sp.]